jgi:murein L,D-transpeptidase YcbB/YkuD
VYITYFTAWVDETGDINFRRDIYGHDAKLAKEIFGK